MFSIHWEVGQGNNTKEADEQNGNIAESVEGRTLTERNSQQNAGDQPQSWDNATSQLLAVRRAAQKDKKRQFTNLRHHVTVDLLRSSFLELKRKAAPGIDGITWKDYQANLESLLESLHDRILNGSYRPKPAKRVFIPKEDGSERPLSIICTEDKIVQQATVTILNSIYEVDFMGFSYGFRPGRSQHAALDALIVSLYKRKVNWVLDLDISKFFDTVEHDWLIRFIEHRVRDRRIVRLIRQWLKVGVVDEHGHRKAAKKGTPQGAVISPLLANIYLHYAFDLWTHKWRIQTSRKEVIVVRYADDAILGFQSKQDAEQYLNDLKERLGMFGLAIHPDKTRLVQFGRFAIEQRQKAHQRKPETFDFLGFTHYCSTTRNGNFCVKRKTAKRRLRKQIKAVGKELMKRRHEPKLDIAQWLQSVVQGHINYYGVPFNSQSLSILLLTK